MSNVTISEHPADPVKAWLLNGCDGRLRPNEVRLTQSTDAASRDARHFELVLPDPEGETWSADDLAELRRAVRDKALEVGLRYPWYVVPRTEHDEAVEDDSDLPPEDD